MRWGIAMGRWSRQRDGRLLRPRFAQMAQMVQRNALEGGLRKWLLGAHDWEWREKINRKELRRGERPVLVLAIRQFQSRPCLSVGYCVHFCVVGITTLFLRHPGIGSWKSARPAPFVRAARLLLHV